MSQRRSNLMIAGKLVERSIEAISYPLSALDRSCIRLASKRRDRRQTSPLNENGHCSLPRFSSLLERLEFEADHEVNPYLTKKILSKRSVQEVVDHIFEHEKIRELLYGYSGTPYRVDALNYLVTHPLPDELLRTRVYANTWHTDLPFSRYTLKIFIAVKSIHSNSGPLTFLDAKDTRQAMRLGFVRDAPNPSQRLTDWLKSQSHEFMGEPGDACIVSPKRCLHRAGIPANGVERHQLMLQLNPARDWCMRTHLAEEQAIREPKLPFFRFATPSRVLKPTPTPAAGLA